MGRNILIIRSQLERILFRGAYIKYVEGGGGGGEGGGLQIFQKHFVAQKTMDLNNSWPILQKIFHGPSHQF